MGIFSEMAKRKEERARDLEGPVFLKPFSSKEEEQKALAAKLEAAPPQSKYIFREALESIRGKTAAHKKIYDALSAIERPMIIFHDLLISSKAGSARVDFAVLTSGFALAIRTKEAEKTGRETKIDSDDFSRMYEGDRKSEETAYLLFESIRETGLVSGKSLRSIWPVTILSDADHSGQRDVCERSFSSDFSGIYPEVRRAQILLSTELPGLIEALFEGDYASSEIPVRKLFDLGACLAKYDSEVTGCPVSYRNDASKEIEK